MTHTYAHLDSFEHQITEEWVGSVAINTNPAYVRAGLASLRLNPSNTLAHLPVTSGGKDGWWGALAAGYCIVSCHIYIAALPGSGQYLYLGHAVGSAAIVRWHARLRSDGKVDLGAEGAWDVTSTGAVEVGKWYQMTVCLPYSSGTAGYVKFRTMAGVEVLSATRNASGDASTAMYFMSAYANGYGDVYIDNLAIESGAAVDDPFLDLTASYAVSCQLINGAGGGDWDVNLHTNEDEVPAATADYSYKTLGAGLTGTYYKYLAVADVFIGKTVNPIKAVQSRAWRGTNGGFGTQLEYVGCYIGSTYYLSAAVGLGDSVANRWLTKCWMTDPSDAAAWTTADLAAINQAGAVYFDNTSTARTSSQHWGCIEAAGSCSYAGGGQILILAAERWKSFLRDLRAGLVPPDQLRRRYRDLVTI